MQHAHVTESKKNMINRLIIKKREQKITKDKDKIFPNVLFYV